MKQKQNRGGGSPFLSLLAFLCFLMATVAFVNESQIEWICTFLIQGTLYTAANSVITELRKDIILAAGVSNALGSGPVNPIKVGEPVPVIFGGGNNEFPGTREKLTSFISADGSTEITIYAPVSEDFLEAIQNENNEDFAFGIARRCVGMTKEQFRNLHVNDCTKIMQTVAKSFHLFRPS